MKGQFLALDFNSKTLHGGITRTGSESLLWCINWTTFFANTCLVVIHTNTEITINNQEDQAWDEIIHQRHSRKKLTCLTTDKLFGEWQLPLWRDPYVPLPKLAKLTLDMTLPWHDSSKLFPSYACADADFIVTVWTLIKVGFPPNSSNSTRVLSSSFKNDRGTWYLMEKKRKGRVKTWASKDESADENYTYHLWEDFPQLVKHFEPV